MVQPRARVVAPTASDIHFTHDGETPEASDGRTNLGGGQGRVRRIVQRAGDGRQVNLLAVGTLSASELYAILRGRWVQENGFHHQVLRWGINQLDGRTTEPYDPDAVIPNPAHRRLDRHVRLARVTAGLARNELAALAQSDPRRGRWDGVLGRATARKRELLALDRPRPRTRRIACANAESDLAATLAEAMGLPGEAKKLLANVLHAPGHVVAGNSVIRCVLADRDQQHVALCRPLRIERAQAAAHEHAPSAVFIQDHVCSWRRTTWWSGSERAGPKRAL